MILGDEDVPVALVHPASKDVKNFRDDDLGLEEWQELNQIDFPPIKEAMDEVPKNWSTEDKYYAFSNNDLSLEELGADGDTLRDFMGYINTGDSSEDHSFRQWLELELLAFPRDAVAHAVYSGYTRWPALEQKILQGGLTENQAGNLAVDYAIGVLEARWPQAEFLLPSADPDIKERYDTKFGANIVPYWTDPIREESPDTGGPVPGDLENENTYQPPQTPLEWDNETPGKQRELALQSWLRPI